MAQTTDAIPRSNFQVEVSTDGTDWTDISGVATGVTRADGDQMIGEQNTAEGFSPIVTPANKKAAETVTVSIVYTENSGEGFKIVHDVYRNGNDDEGGARVIYLRWAPKGGIGTVVGNTVFTCSTDGGTPLAVGLINCTMPELDASSGDPALCEFSVRTPNILEALTTTT
jgi:hypothetical protein